MNQEQEKILSLYSQLLSVAHIVKYEASRPRISSITGFGATLSALTKEEMKALEKEFNLRFFSSGCRRNMTIFTFVDGEYIEKPVIRAIPLEHICPPECYRIHLTTPPDAATPSMPSTPISEELLERVYKGEAI